MDRNTNYPGQVPLETDLLKTNQFTMTALAKLCAAVLGVASCVNGFGTTQTTVPSLAVLVAPGEIYSLQNLEATAWSSMPADLTHSIVKQGIALNTQTIPITPPGTAGFSINYLIQATYQDSDTGSTVLPYYNASNPAVAYSGPANSGTAQPTTRAGAVVVSAKAGTAATTGTQTTPAPDAGYVGLYVVTVANGASTVINSNITALASAPFINSTLLGLTPAFSVPLQVAVATAVNQAPQMSQVSGVVGSTRNLVMMITAASVSGTLTADEIVVETALGGVRYCLSNFSKTINVTATGAGGMDTGSAPVSGYLAFYAIYSPSTGASALLATNATSAVQPNIYGGANMPAGYTASALLTVVPTNASSQIQACFVQDRHVTINQTNQISTSTTGSNVLFVLGVPKNAKSADLFANFSCTAASNANIALGGNSSVGLPTVSFQPSGQSGAISAPKFPLSTPQTIWYTFSSSAGTPTMIITLYGWDI